MFGKPKHSKARGIDDFGSDSEYNNHIALLFDTPVHQPKHQKIELPSLDDGLAWAAQLDKSLWAYEYFDDYPDYIHLLCNSDEDYRFGPWRLEQRSDWTIMMGGIESGPVAGLGYQLYYNSCRIGELEIQPLTSIFEIPDGYKEARLHISIDCAPFIPHKHLDGLLLICSQHFDLYKDREDRQPRREAITRAITNTMWEAIRQDSMWENLYFQYDGVIDLNHKIMGR